MSDLLDYKIEKLDEWDRTSEAYENYPENSFCIDYCSLLSEGGHLDDPEILDDAHRDTNRGTRLDAWSWNETEGVITLVVSEFDELKEILSISEKEIETAANRAIKFLDIAINKTLDFLDPSSSGFQAAESLKHFIKEDNLVKFRVAVISTKEMSSRAQKSFSKKDQKFKLKKTILDKECFVEVYDLKRLKDIEQSGDQAEPVDVDFLKIGEPIKALPANIGDPDVDSYLCIMPATVLSDLYEEYGQRLLESNVRTFLQFGGKVNKGIRETLLNKPDNFFAYNNGLTVTSKNIKKRASKSGMEITQIDDMQIVNGGQTSSAIYFAPKDKTKIASGGAWKDINLNKVFVQMKLSVIKKDADSEEMKENIAKYANSQNAVSASDLQSNHPFHRKLEEISRRLVMPAGDSSITSKWFYERARGQYQTQKRKLGSLARQKKFEVDYPRYQVITKNDLAKYENTWRMNPHEVKLGAQRNFLKVSEVLSKEYEKDEAAFRDQFYKDAVAKAIWFKESDKEIQKSDWYSSDKGLKAETTTYTLALIRHILNEENKELNLKKIYDSQKISDTMKNQVVSLGKEVRDKMKEDSFRDGTANISEFCKKQSAWEKFKQVGFDLKLLDRTDWLNVEEQKDVLSNTKETSKASDQIETSMNVFETPADKWIKLAEYYSNKGYSLQEKNVNLPSLMGSFLNGEYKNPKFPSEPQIKTLLELLKEAEEDDFIYLN